MDKISNNIEQIMSFKDEFAQIEQKIAQIKQECQEYDYRIRQLEKTMLMVSDVVDEEQVDEEI